jgi:hypothetical protein
METYVTEVSPVTRPAFKKPDSLPVDHVKHQLGNGLPHLLVHEVGVVDGARRSSLDVTEILVYPFDEGTSYLVV